MTPREMLDALGWSVQRLADEVHRPHGTVRRWVDGTAQMPEPVRAWLARLAEAHLAIPAPEWRGWE